METSAKSGRTVCGDSRSETHRSPKSVRINGASVRTSINEDELPELYEPTNITHNGYHRICLTHGQGSLVINDTDKTENEETRKKQTRNETLAIEEMKGGITFQDKNGMDDNSSSQHTQRIKRGTQNESQEVRLKLQQSGDRTIREIGSQCDPDQLERREPAILTHEDAALQHVRDSTCLTERESRSTVETHPSVKTLQDGTRMTDTEQGDVSTITGKLENGSNEKEVTGNWQESKHVLELEKEIQVLKCKLEESEKKAVEIQQKYDEAFLKLVGDNRRMNENLKDIQVHVRREKIESERTKDEVEKVLQERQKLIDEVKGLTKDFESMVGERERMEMIIETSICAFDSKLHTKDEEIRDLQETIDNDRKQFVEERDEYLTMIESLKAELLLQQEHMEERKAM